MIVDCERANFNVFQCAFPENYSQKIVAIDPVNATSNSSPNPSNPRTPKSHGLPTRDLVGIVVGSVLLSVVVLSLVILTLIRKRKRRRFLPANRFEKAELDAKDILQHPKDVKHELDAYIAGLDHSQDSVLTGGKRVLHKNENNPVELPSDGAAPMVHEMEGNEPGFF